MPCSKHQRNKHEVLLKQVDDLYGYRGPNPNLYWLNAWEFLMYWECLPLPKATLITVSFSGEHQPLTIYRTVAHRDRDEWVINDNAESSDIIFYPLIPGQFQLRWHWYMERRRRPMTPSPANTPMLDKFMGEQKARLFTIYMRSWVLDHQHSSVHVPHFTNLDVVPEVLLNLNTKRIRLVVKQKSSLVDIRSYEKSWRWYVRGHVVSLHA